MIRVVSRIGLAAIIAMLALWSSPVAAQANGPGPAVVHSDTASTVEFTDVVDAFGVSNQWKVLHVADWSPWNGSSGLMGYQPATGYIYPMDPSDDFWTQLTVPVGCQINYIFWYVYDNDAACYWYLSMGRYESSTGAENPAWDGLVYEQTGDTETPGYVRITSDLTADPIRIIAYGDINSDGDYNYVSYNAHAELLACGGDTNMRLFGIAFNFSRVISPAPASASFNDVPVGAFGFQHIQALYSSGITGGCGGGNFCPNQPLTRAQMAVFLAKALGLHWAY